MKKVWEKVEGTNLYKYEVLTNVVDLGFHICLTKEDVAKIVEYTKVNDPEINSIKVIEVFYKAIDVIAYGTWLLNKEVKCLVADKITINSLGE